MKKQLTGTEVHHYCRAKLNLKFSYYALCFQPSAAIAIVDIARVCVVISNNNNYYSEYVFDIVRMALFIMIIYSYII